MKETFAECVIENFNERGFGVAPCPSGKGVIEVAHAIKGDFVRVQLMRRRPGVKKGRLLEILQESLQRISPCCPHASLCGGCSWQAMEYDTQVAIKQESINRAFGNLIHENVEVRPMIAAEDPWRYRNKMEFSFSENRAGTKFLGLMIAHAEPFVFNVEECHIAPSWMSECLVKVRAWWEESKLQAYYPPQDRGTLRYLTVRQTVRTKKKMVILNVSGNPAFAPSKENLDQFTKLFEEDVSVFVRIHQTLKGTPTKFFEWHLQGPDHMVEEMHLQHGILQFKISPSSFFQPNTLQAERLYNVAVSLLKDRSKIIYDLYCGTGSLAIAAASKAERIIGIELSPEAILDAKENAKQNKLSHVEFYQGDVGRVLTALLGSEITSPPDAVILDPPRCGLDELALSHLKRLCPERIVYVSCNPVTQAQNIRELVKSGYTLKVLQGVDQFPHTAHVELVALLMRS